MLRISPATSDRRRNRRATTLAELTVVLFILVLLSTAVVPRVIAYTKSQAAKTIEAKIARLPAEARSEAVNKQMPVTLRVSGSSLIMEDAPTDGTAATEVKTVDLGDGIEVDSVQLNGKQSDTGSWVWTVYPDGSADKAAVQFAEGTARLSLVMQTDGTSQWTTGDAPDQTQDEWQAGTLQQRTSS
ncbi:MAG TPA: GspH/FimT family pseudopilin [Capsulimonadaceae bacterium]